MIVDKIRRMNNKDKIVFSNIVGALLIKGLSLLVSLFTMPVYMNYFSDQKILGVWFTVLSIVSWILNFDLGIGNGLRNKLTVALTRDDEKEAKILISSSYFSIGIIVLIIGFIGYVLLSFINWNSFFNIPETTIANHVLFRVVLYVFIGILFQFFLRLVSSILYALQLSSINNFILLITSILQLGFALLAPIQSPEENIIMFSKAYIVCANFPLLIASVCVFLGPLKKCIPSLKYIRLESINTVLSLGGLFFFCQVMYMLIVNTNEFFITQYTGPNEVVEYQIYNKLFTLGSTLFMLALTPLWSAISKAIAEKDFRWLDITYNRIIKISFVTIIPEFLLIPFLQIIVNIWLGENSINISFYNAFIFAVYGTLMVFQSAVSTVGNGLGKLKIQAICYFLGIVFKFIFIHFIFIFRDNWIFIILANVLILLPYCIIQHKYIRKFLSNIQNDNK